MNADEVDESEGNKAWKENFREGLNWLGAEYTKTPRLGDKICFLLAMSQKYGTIPKNGEFRVIDKIEGF